MNLELYYFETCPFCQRVLRQIDELGLKNKIILKDVHASQEARDFHYQTTGRSTVPCLYIDGKPLFESSDICEWLIENQANL